MKRASLAPARETLYTSPPRKVADASSAPVLFMSKKGFNEAKFLALLEKVLPKATPDTVLAAKIYEHVAKEVRLVTSLEAFEKFCEKGSLPDAEPHTIEEFKSQLGGNFGPENVVVTPPEPDAEEKAVEVEITLPDRTVTSKLKIVPPGEEGEEADAPFVPFPVALPEDPELVWVLARRENLGPDEAARALAGIEEEFWASKKGQVMQRDGVERSFAEFISNVPATALKESGIKRYHKDPETLKTLRLIPGEGAAPASSREEAITL